MGTLKHPAALDELLLYRLYVLQKAGRERVERSYRDARVFVREISKIDDTTALCRRGEALDPLLDIHSHPTISAPERRTDRRTRLRREYVTPSI